MCRMMGGRDMMIVGAAFGHMKRVVGYLRVVGVSLECDNLRLENEKLLAQILAQQLSHNQEKLNRLIKSMNMLDSSLLKNCMGLWKDHLNNSKQQLLKGTRFFSKLLRALETRTFTNWKNFAADSVRKKRRVYNICAKIVFSSMSAGWTAWVEFIAEKSKVSGAASEAPRAKRAASEASRERSEPRAKRAASEASRERSEPLAKRAASEASR